MDAGVGRGRGRPFELDLSQEVCDRATRLARTLFDRVDAQIILVQDGRAWRNRHPNAGQEIGPGVRAVLDAGEAIWVEDARLDDRFADLAWVVRPPYVRFYAAAPIRLDNDVVAGVIAVTGLEVRPYNSSLAGRLSDLAAFVADEWARAQAAKAREQGRRERDASIATFNAVVQAMPVSLVMADRDLRIQGASPRWAAEVGLTDRTVVGRCLNELRPEFVQLCGPMLKRALEGETIAEDRLPWASSGASSGASGWTTVEIAPWRLINGEVGGVIIATHDVTHMVEALDASERSEQRLKLALEIADIHVYEIDYNRRELIKIGAEDTFFDEPQTYQSVYKDVYSTVDVRDRASVQAAWERHLQTGETFRPEHRVARADGKEVWTSASCYLISEQGRAARLIGAMQNITERKRVERALVSAKEEAEAANRAKSTFLATMSHEIRTPLNGVLGMAQAMSADELSPLQRQRLNVVRQSGEALLTILNDVLDLSKIEACKLELEETDFDLGSLFRDALASFAAISDRKGVPVELSVDAAALGVYRGDSTRVRQILHNLVSNALKFTETGEVKVAVARLADGVQISVADSGIGIPADRLASLFEKFEQVDASTTRRFGGTGLGLAICRELARMFGGAIWAESTFGAGSTFFVQLPLTRTGDEKVQAQPRVDAAPGAQHASGLRLLAAEDNTVNQLVLKTLLAQAGIDPVIVSDGAQAVAAWEDRDWDVILMDVQMPVLDGLDATRAIRSREAKTGRARTPIIALTANAMSHQLSQYDACGMDDYVGKPIEVGKLFDVIERVLEAAETDAPVDKPGALLAG